MDTPYLYDALDVKQDFNKARLDAQYNAQLATQIKGQADEKEKQQQLALEGLGMYQQKAAEAMKDLLPQDVARVQAKHNQLTQGISDMLKDHGADPSLFYKSGGRGLLDKYTGDMISSPELQQGIQNKKNSIQLLADHASGKIWRPEQQQALDDFTAGRRKDLPYAGSVSPIKFDPAEFLKIENPEGTPGNFVSRNMLEQFARLKEGYSGPDAKVAVDNFFQNNPNAINPKNPALTTLRWGNVKPRYGAAMYGEQLKENGALGYIQSLNNDFQSANTGNLPYIPHNGYKVNISPDDKTAFQPKNISIPELNAHGKPTGKTKNIAMFPTGRYVNPQTDEVSIEYSNPENPNVSPIVEKYGAHDYLNTVMPTGMRPALSNAMLNINNMAGSGMGAVYNSQSVAAVRGQKYTPVIKGYNELVADNVAAGMDLEQAGMKAQNVLREMTKAVPVHTIKEYKEKGWTDYLIQKAIKLGKIKVK